MACYRPLAAMLSPAGTPIVVRRRLGVRYPVELRCGQCIGCRLQRSRDWAVRAVHEAQLHSENSFVTLTYSDEHLPEFGSLKPSDLTKFLKRLRYFVGPFRYLACGEYGEKKGRAHFHLIVFGQAFMADRYYWKKSPKTGMPLYRSPTLERAWTYGHCDIGSMTFDSAAYVARYVTKKQTGPTADLAKYAIPGIDHRTLRRKAEYNVMSRNPGIASKWIERYWRDVYPADQVHVNGKPCRPPRFYDKFMEEKQPDIWAQVQLQRRRKAEETRDHPDSTPRRLQDRESICVARTSRFARDPEEDSLSYASQLC